MYEGVSHKGAALIAVVVPILNLPDDLDIYDEIYLGYPNYWNTMPMAVYTFLEQYDFTSKTIPSAPMRAAAFPYRAGHSKDRGHEGTCHLGQQRRQCENRPCKVDLGEQI